MSERTHGAGGWPLFPSKRWPGELTLQCPQCHSQACTMSVEYPVHGTGPGGRGRLGDPGAKEYVRCNKCGYKSYDGTEPWQHECWRPGDGPPTVGSKRSVS